MKKLIFLCIAGMISAAQANAQSSFGMSYVIGFPSGDVKDYISSASFRGLTVDYQRQINDNIGAGISLGWTLFYQERAKETYTNSNTSLTGKQYRYSHHVPMLLNASYYLRPDETLNPFGRLGIGTIYTRRYTDMGQYTYELEAWNFALVPEIGVRYTLNEANTFILSVKYYGGFQAGNQLDSGQSFLTLNFGYML